MAPESRPLFSASNCGTTQGVAPLAKALRFLAIAAIHLTVLAGAAIFVRPELATDVERIYVRMVEEASPAVERALPTPPARPKPGVRPEPPPVAPVLAAAADSASPAPFAVAPAPPAPVVEPAPASAAPVVVEARVDADYLHNPKPVYPLAARRRGDQGRVVLRVHVSVQGTAMAVEIGQSSGYSSLDEAARDAVLRWRFVPARRGGEAIESWVVVPIVFRLDG